MKKYHIQVTETALRDLEELYEYIAVQLQSPENAMGQYNRITEAVSLFHFMNLSDSFGSECGML